MLKVYDVLMDLSPEGKYSIAGDTIYRLDAPTPHIKINIGEYGLSLETIQAQLDLCEDSVVSCIEDEPQVFTPAKGSTPAHCGSWIIHDKNVIHAAKLSNGTCVMVTPKAITYMEGQGRMVLQTIKAVKSFKHHYTNNLRLAVSDGGNVKVFRHTFRASDYGVGSNVPMTLKFVPLETLQLEHAHEPVSFSVFMGVLGRRLYGGRSQDPHTIMDIISVKPYGKVKKYGMLPRIIMAVGVSEHTLYILTRLPENNQVWLRTIHDAV